MGAFERRDDPAHADGRGRRLRFAVDITIGAGSTSGTGTISTSEDADRVGETFTVALGSLPDSGTAGSPSWVTVTDDDDPGFVFTPAEVPVDEGVTATYTVALDAAPAETVTVSVVSLDPVAAAVFPETLTFNAVRLERPADGDRDRRREFRH